MTRVAVPHRGRTVEVPVVPGELLAITGQDGVGTSSLLRALAAAVPSSVLLDQPPGTDWSDQDVAGELAAPAALADLGMASPPERQLWMLSTGERQRVRLARVLAAPADVLLLDEPLGGLDQSGVAVTLDRLRARVTSGAAVLVVAKGDERVAAAADRVLELTPQELHAG